MAQTKGLDVSKHNGVVDWAKVGLAGYDFVLIRAGFGNTAKQKDPRFEENIKGALARGMHVGVYWFNYCRSVEEAIAEAKAFKEVITPYSGKIDFPVSLDYEYDSIKYFREEVGSDPTNALINDMVTAFIKEMQSGCWFSNLYTNLDFIRSGRFSDTLRNSVDLWLADYSGGPDFPCGIQQTMSTGSIPGITGNVDIDIAYKDYPSIIRAKGMNGLKAAVAPAPVITQPSQSEITVGMKVQYSGPLFADSFGNGQGKTVAGVFTVQRIAEGRKCGICLPLGWVPASACKIAGSVPTPLTPAKNTVLKAGAKVQYSGYLYADSYGGGQGAKVSGTYAVQRELSGRKCGVLLPAGWVPSGSCKVVG